MNKTKISKLKNIIEESLIPLITNDYALIEVPCYDNIGDNLIWEGELAFLKNIPFIKKYECSLHFFEQNKIPENCIILLQGGGNFGDIYPVVNDFRKKVIKDNLDKKIIIFPQTIYYKDLENIEKDAEIMNLHKDLTICVRDKISYNLARKYFLNANVLLLPDMAFCIDLDTLKSKKKGNKILVMSRRDGEKVEINLDDIGEFDLLDWPTFNITKEKRYKKIQFNRRLDKIARLFQKLPILSLLIDSKYGLKDRRGRENYIKQGVEFFGNYQTIYTTRLHGLILGVLMGKNIKILDNSYGKLTSFTETWLSDFENIEICNKKGQGI